MKRGAIKEFPLWLSRLRTQYCLCEDAGSIPGHDQWVKDLVLLHKVQHSLQMRLGSSVVRAVA